MSSKEKCMLINETSDETRIAITENSFLEELQVEQKAKIQIKGNIYRGVVVQIESSLEAAFVDIGLEKNGFLGLNEVNFQQYPGKKEKNSSMYNHLKVGQPVLVQVVREPMNAKGAALTTFISLCGRYLNYLPEQKNANSIAQKTTTTEEEKQQIKAFLDSLNLVKDSVVVRAFKSADLRSLNNDLTNLKNLWVTIKQTFNERKKVGMVHQEIDLSLRMVRDYFDDSIQKVWIDNPQTFSKIYEFFQSSITHRIRDLKLFNQQEPLFHFFDIERQIESLSFRQVHLPSGGNLVIEQTEALVAIDVNSARSIQEKSNEDTALRTNLEAAQEVARQLRLRNLGGLIVIDFIDMEKRDWQKKVEATMVEAMQADKAQHSITPISNLGLLALSRQRISQGYAASTESVCLHCQGKGRVPNKIAIANQILRKFREIASSKNLASLSIQTNFEIANYLLNEKRTELSNIELECQVKLIVLGQSESTETTEIVCLDANQTQQFSAPLFANKNLLQSATANNKKTSANRASASKTRERFATGNATTAVRQGTVQTNNQEEQKTTQKTLPPEEQKTTNNQLASPAQRPRDRVRTTDSRRGYKRPTIIPELTLSKSCLFPAESTSSFFPWDKYDVAGKWIDDQKGKLATTNIYPSNSVFESLAPLILTK